MRYLALGLFAEGDSDHGFLRRIVYRSVHEIAMNFDHRPLEMPEDFVRGQHLGAPSRREDRVLESFRDAIEQSVVNLLFIHADSGNDRDAAWRERVKPACDLLHERYADLPFKCVPIIPVRETEAWALADPEALQAELGTALTVRQLGLPSDPAAIERIVDPKKVLHKACNAVRTNPRRRRGNPIIPAGLGDRVALAKLRRLSAFVEFERCVRQALDALWQRDAK